MGVARHALLRQRYRPPSGRGWLRQTGGGPVRAFQARAGGVQKATQLQERPGPGRDQAGPLLARHQRRHHHGHQPEGRHRRQAGAVRRPAVRRGAGPQWLAALRLRLGRPRGPGGRSRRPAHRRQDRGRRASQPDRRASRRTIGCSSPAPRATASSVIDTKRGIVTETIFTALFPQAPEGSTPDALAVAPDGETLFVANADNNCVAVIDIARAQREPGEGLHPHRLVSDGRGRHARRQEAAGRRRQGEPDAGRTRSTEATRQAETSRTAAAAVPVHRHDALRRAVDRAGARTRSSWPSTPTRSIATARTPTSCSTDAPYHGEDGDPDEGRRPVADQARHLHHQGEPHLRSGVRRHRARATATRRW